MRTVISIFYTVFMVFIFAQDVPQKKENSSNIDSAVLKDIEKVTEINYQKIEEVKSIKSATAEEMREIERIDQRRKQILDSIEKTLKKIFKKPSKSSTNMSTSTMANIKHTPIKLNLATLDSTCVDEKRDVLFSKKKCIKWEYFKTITDDNNRQIVLKIEK